MNIVNAVFLDRDGVLNHEVGHISRVEQIQLLPGVPGAVRRLNQRGIPVVVGTNQSVIGRGLCSEEDVEQIHLALQELLSDGQANIDSFYYCPHHPTEGLGRYLLDCECRKPQPGMLVRAAADLGLDLSSSVIVGDSLSDMEAGWAAGCRTVLVATGHGVETKRRMESHLRQPDYIATGLDAAIDWILDRRIGLRSGSGAASGKRT